MDINVTPPTPHYCNISIPDGQVQKLYSGINKLMTYIEDNKKLGYRDKNRLRADERNELIDLSERLEKVIEHINKEKND